MGDPRPLASSKTAGAAADGDGAAVGAPPRRLAVAALLLGIALTVVDGAIANVALPTIARALAVSPRTSVLIVNAYQVAVAISLLPLAALGDRVGFRRIFLSGLSLFIVASIGCAGARSFAALGAWRTLQGFGAAGVMCVGTALTRHIYPRAMLGRGLGLNTLVVALSTAAAPTIGALLLSLGHWPLIFAINIPLGLASAVAGLFSLPRNRPAEGRFDGASALLGALAIGLMLLTVEGIGAGRPLLVVGVTGGAGAVAAAIFLRRQFEIAPPLLPVDLMRQPVFGLSLATAAVSFCAQALAMVVIPFFLTRHLHLRIVDVGLAMSAWPLAVMVTAPVAGRLADRPSGDLGAAGLTIASAGFVLLALLPEGAGLASVVWRMAVCGVGFGLFQLPNTRRIIEWTPPHRTGSVSGTIGTVRLVGQTAGASLAALALAGGAQWPALATPAPSAFLALAAASLSLFRSAKQPTGERVTALP